ncbi:uncharacterized protein METZ01_LOCUS186632 [marine metagenome]|uniref:Uncharacterized protein n=1 Tax=marine metagenome TaxID=408172 RepID=A0A382D5Q6_9ZZZZ
MSFLFNNHKVLSFAISCLIGPLAQLVEQLAFNQLVEGSNPSRPTIFFK